ncbi:hypothetical protein [Streptomyces sp. ICBB 8177]|uniref:hypothetical protein n=1 Tax=Streptomyces sp. ICBB 8177 TaxID=563922 RepID=UPI000D6723C0|nr:hypothetical protein [Streptomyces sp. ICBB 8177]PWI43994.1 hypothetical protein CK485_18260 [Streptomyces sp. ICBB 8177]
MTHAPQAPGAGARPAGERSRNALAGADPVRELMLRHHDLCAGAVDPLEIAAGLEACGVTDRDAARCRHRDVFSLAEELYARVPRVAVSPQERPLAVQLTRRHLAWHLLPGAACLAGIAVSHAAGPRWSAAAGGAALVAVAAAARAAVRRGPLRAPRVPGTALVTCWLLAFALYGPAVLDTLLGLSRGGPGGLLDPVAASGFLARALALPPAAWLAVRFARRGRRRLADSHDLAEFGAGMRPVALGVLAAFALALTALLTFAYAALDGRAAGGDGGAGAGVVGGAGGGAHAVVALAGAGLLGLLLFTAQLLAVHGHGRAALAGTAAACAVEAAALALAAAGRLPGLAAASAPLRLVARAQGPGAVQALACAGATLALAAFALAALARGRAHHAPTAYGPPAAAPRPAGHGRRQLPTAATSADRAAAR